MDFQENAASRSFPTTVFCGIEKFPDYFFRGVEKFSDYRYLRTREVSRIQYSKGTAQESDPSVQKAKIIDAEVKEQQRNYNIYLNIGVGGRRRGAYTSCFASVSCTLKTKKCFTSTPFYYLETIYYYLIRIFTIILLFRDYFTPSTPFLI